MHETCLNFLVLPMVLAELACASPNTPSTETPVSSSRVAPNPDRVFMNGTVWSGRGLAEAFAVKGGRFTAVGSNAKISALAGPETQIVDLEGAFVVPGFIDNHVHFLSGGFNLASVDLRSASSPEDFTKRMSAFAAGAPKGRWIIGGDWDHEAWGGALPTRQWIDAVTPNNPVFVSRLDGHMALANSETLRLASIGAETPDPPGGAIVRDPKTKEPTGVLKDTAMALVTKVQPEPTKEEIDEALTRASRHALENGVTQVHDMGSLGGWTDLAAYRRAQEKGDLLLRIYTFVPIATWERLHTYVAKHGRGDDWLRWGGLKGFVDGSLGSTTAWFHEPYDVDPSTSGLVVTPSSKLRSWILDASKAGLHLAVHAIGDRANDWLLDVFKDAAAQLETAPRFRVEHAQHLSPPALARFGELGVIPSMQPYHAIDDGRWAEKSIGPVRIKTTYAFRSLIDTRARVTFGSDWTVAPISPLRGIYAAVTRRTLDGAHPDGWVPAEKITVEQALRAYTAANAYAGFQEKTLGTIETGKLADFVVLSQDLLSIDPKRIPEVRVLRTVIGGDDRYVAGSTRED